MLNTNAEITQALNANTDAFMAFSKIAISSIEQLIALNLSCTRSSLEASAATPVMLLESTGAMSSSKAKKAAPLAVSEIATTYFQSLQEIVTGAQEETTKLITTYLASHGNASSHDAGWLKGFDVVKGLGDQISAFSEASRKAMTDVTSGVVKQTNVHSRKAA